MSCSRPPVGACVPSARCRDLPTGRPAVDRGTCCEACPPVLGFGNQSAEETMLAQMKPPFRAEQIGSLLRPQSLLDQRARFTRGEIDQAALTAAEDQAIQDALVAAGARRAEVRHRRRIPPPLLSQLLLPPARRHQHRHRRRRGRQGRQRRDPRRPAGRADQQPRALDASDQRAGLRVHPRQHLAGAEDHHPRPLRAALPRRRRGGAGAAPTRTSSSSGTIPSRRSAGSLRRCARPAAATCRSTKPRSRSSAIRRSSGGSRRAATTGAR